MNFKKLLAKVVNLIFKYILSSYFIECGWRCCYKTSSTIFILFFVFLFFDNGGYLSQIAYTSIQGF